MESLPGRFCPLDIMFDIPGLVIQRSDSGYIGQRMPGRKKRRRPEVVHGCMDRVRWKQIVCNADP